MAIVAKAGANGFPTHPADLFPAVCIDVVDLGEVEVTYQGKAPRKVHKILIRWFCGVYHEREDTGEKIPLWVNRKFTNSLAEKSSLLPFLETWRNQPFTAEELKNGFDLEKLIGAPAFVQVSHKAVGTNTYANVVACTRLPKELTRIDPPTGYVRAKDRVDDEAHQPNANDDDLPF